jgi:CheY-like chemotaxis protein
VHPSDPFASNSDAGDSDPQSAGIPLGGSKPGSEARALCIGFDAVRSAQLSTVLEGESIRHEHVATPTEALAHLVAGPVDLVAYADGLSLRDLTPLAAQARRISPATKIVVVGDRPRGGRLLSAMRAGAVDWVELEGEGDAASRFRAALAMSREERQRDERVARLKGICRKLSVARDDFARHVDALSDGLEHAMSDVRGKLDEAALAGEFRGLLSQELDVEDLLRTAMQYMLTKTGATNAAVFLPGSKPTQFGLGAYVHYDCPRATAEPLLSRLGDEICPRLAAEPDIVRFADTADFVQAIGAEASVLDDCELVAFSARHNDECMAVFFLFRHRSEPFRDELAGLLDSLRPVFAAQMAKLVRVHHRSKFSWPQAAAEGDDDATGEDESEGDGWRKAA